MVAWLVALHILELMLTRASREPPRLDDALLKHDSAAIYSLLRQDLGASPKPPRLVTEYLNAGKYPEDCLLAILNAYYDVVMLKEWQSTATPTEYLGPLTKSAAVPDVSYPVADAPGETADARSPLQIAGQSKGNRSQKVSVRIDRPSQQAYSWNIGEDAVGVSPDRSFLVVADGVGGAAHSETVSRALTVLSLRLHQDKCIGDLLAASTKLISSLQLFLRRFALSGSTTLLVAQKTAAGSLNVLNVGDCSCLVVGTDSSIKLLTEEQWYAANTPYQLNEHIDVFHPKMAARYRVEGLANGDRVFLFSDGIGDNVWPRQVAQVRSASQLLLLARAQAEGSIGFNIPFSHKVGEKIYGKMDDMSVILVQV